jgi:hypothetical protein
MFYFILFLYFSCHNFINFTIILSFFHFFTRTFFHLIYFPFFYSLIPHSFIVYFKILMLFFIIFIIHTKFLTIQLSPKIYNCCRTHCTKSCVFNILKYVFLNWQDIFFMCGILIYEMHNISYCL